MYRVLVCGDRNWSNDTLIRNTLQSIPNDKIKAQEVELIVGGARGADTIAERVGVELGFNVRVFPAKWDEHGKAAGPIRNRQMLDEKPDIVFAFHHDITVSKGTADCIKEAQKRGIPVVLLPPKTHIEQTTF